MLGEEREAEQGSTGNTEARQDAQEGQEHRGKAEEKNMKMKPREG